MKKLPAAMTTRLPDQPLIVFDGTCVMCSAFYRFVLRFDRDQVFRFATAQSDIGEALYLALELPVADYETNLVVINSRAYTHLDSLAAVMGHLPGPWRAFRALHLLPLWLKTPVYRLIARNRFRLFGRYDSCLVPDATARARFVTGGWSQPSPP